MYPDDRAEVSGLLALLSGAVALLLAIACANVAGNVVVARLGRTREIAIRLATGATRQRILSQLLTEGLMLLASPARSAWCWPHGPSQAIIAASQGMAPSLVRDAGAEINGTVLAFTLLGYCRTGLLVALAPALQSLKVDLTSSLKSGLPGSGVRSTRLRSALVAGQVALSLVLLSGAGLLLRGLYRIVTETPGFDSNRSHGIRRFESGTVFRGTGPRVLLNLLTRLTPRLAWSPPAWPTAFRRQSGPARSPFSIPARSHRRKSCRAANSNSACA